MIVAICICTFRRPNALRDLLGSLRAIATPDDVRVFVADNDLRSEEGLQVCQALRAGGYRWPIAAFVTHEPGISAARNAVIGAALADPEVEYLAMLDDDEWVEPDWLTELLRMRDQTQADIVAGKVEPVFDAPEESWRAGCAMYRHDDGSEGRVENLYGAGNIMASREALLRLPHPLFDPEFSFTGGEDRHFFRIAKRSGLTFARAPRALAFELYAAERTTRRWVLRRAYRVGSVEVLSNRKLGMNVAQIARFWLRMPIALTLDVLRLLVSMRRGAAQVNALSDLWRDSGRLAGMFGHRCEAYGGAPLPTDGSATSRHPGSAG